MNATAAMRWSGGSWFTVAVTGQWIFAAYIALLYGRATLSGDLRGWNRVMPHGFIPGDPAGNAAVGIHLLWAFVLLVTGAVQLIPQVRRAWPALHRWSGRIYVSAAALTSLAGLYMVATRGSAGGPLMSLSVSLNGVLILAFAAMAWRQARARRFTEHRRWALRLFLAASGVWFFRIGLMLWLVIHRAPVGFDPDTFRGPLLDFLGFAQYLVPLAVLELYFAVERNGTRFARLALTAALAILTLATAGGVVSATLIMWLPRV